MGKYLKLIKQANEYQQYEYDDTPTHSTPKTRSPALTALTVGAGGAAVGGGAGYLNALRKTKLLKDFAQHTEKGTQPTSYGKLKRMIKLDAKRQAHEAINAAGNAYGKAPKAFISAPRSLLKGLGVGGAAAGLGLGAYALLRRKRNRQG